MTENEARKLITDLAFDGERVIERLNMLDEALDPRYTDADESSCALQIAIETLEEIQQYRAIGTVEECRAAIERVEQKRVEFYGDCEDGKLLCPSCKEDLWDIKECGFNNCPFCGQRIVWMPLPEPYRG